MIVLFAGPTLCGADPDLAGIELRPPARQGDVARAVLDGAAAIGLVDGNFEATASVWHKEILFALSRGVHVLGAASMGALRAAECAAFGMVPVGWIANAYLDGRLDDDAAVAQLHAPVELGYLPLTETLVDAEASICRLRELGLISPTLARQVTLRARALFFKDRTIEAIFDGFDRAGQLAAHYRRHRVSIKQQDALELIERLRTLGDAPPAVPEWVLAQPRHWTRALGRIASDAGGAAD